MFWQAKNCSAIHIQINPSYLSFFRAVATSIFAADVGVNLGFGCGSSTTDHREALTEHATASHFVQVALALQIKCSCIRAAIATRGGQTRDAELADLSHRCVLSRSETVGELLSELSGVPANAKWASKWAVKPSTLMQYLASFYGTMAAQGLADVSVPESKLRLYLTGMRALLVFSKALKIVVKAKDPETARVVDVLLSDLGSGQPFSDGADRRRALAIVSDVVAHFRGRRGAGLAVLRPYHRSKHELFRPNTTWCNKQDRRPYSIRKEDREQEDQLAMVPLPMDTVPEVEHHREIVCWLPLVAAPAGAEVDVGALRANETLGVMTYDMTARTHEDAVAFAKTARGIVGGDELTRRRQQDLISRPGRVAYVAMTGLTNSAAHEAPYHMQASKAMTETLVSAGVVGMQDLETKLEYAFPNDPVDSRQTAIALVFSAPADDVRTRNDGSRPQSRPKSPRPKSPRPKSPRPKSPRPKSRQSADAMGAEWPDLYLRDRDEITSCEDEIVVEAGAKAVIYTLRPDTEAARNMALVDRFGGMIRVLRSDRMDRMFLCISTRSIDIALSGDTAIPLLEFYTTERDRIVLDDINEDDERLPDAFSLQDDDIESTDMVAMRGICLHAAQVTAISAASDPVISHMRSEMHLRADRCRQIILALIELSQSNEMGDDYMGPGYTEQLKRLRRLLSRHAGLLPGSGCSADRFHVVLPSNVWLHQDCESQFAELQQNMRCLRAVVVKDGPGPEIPIVAFSTAFALSKAGNVLAHEAPAKLDYIERTEQGESYAVLDEVLVLRTSDPASEEVRAGRRYDRSTCIQNLRVPYVDQAEPLYVFALTKFQRDTIRVCASSDIQRALRELALQPQGLGSEAGRR